MHLYFKLIVKTHKELPLIKKLLTSPKKEAFVLNHERNRIIRNNIVITLHLKLKRIDISILFIKSFN